MWVHNTMLLVAAVISASTIASAEAALNCTSGLRKFNPLIHKRTYYIGVHAVGGIERAERDYNLTFEEYLTATAGQRFDPPIEFKMKATNLPLKSWVDEIEEEVDFYYADSGIYSCVGLEKGAEPVATTVSEYNIRGHEFQLDMFAGAIFTKADRDDIVSIKDLKDKKIGALEIAAFAGAQSQFYMMKQAGMDFYMDPKEVIFTGNELDVVRGVHKGLWDVGFVRTGMIEKTTDEETGELLDPDLSLFKMIDPKLYVMDDGNLFPYLHSTPVFPEWPLSSNVRTPQDVIMEVQEALYALHDHRAVGQILDECYLQESEEQCMNAMPELYPSLRCDTTPDLAMLAHKAAAAGTHDGFRPPRSYHGVRTMQLQAGFAKATEKGGMVCSRDGTLYGAIDCPTGTYKLSEHDFEESCDIAGAPCPEGSRCYCRPCVEAFEVDVFEYNPAANDTDVAEVGCEKMSLCASVHQTKTITFNAKDNMERENAVVRAVMHVGQEQMELPVSPVADRPWIYEFEFSHTELGIGILEFYVNGEQIPTSPIRVEIVSRDCNQDFPGQSKTSDRYGQCVCGDDTVQIGNRCVSSVLFFVLLSAGIFGLVAMAGLWYLGYKKRQNDQLWLVGVEELQFQDPVQVIGQGSFGVVLLAEFRGTKVAIKRALKPGQKVKGGSRTASANNSGNMTGKGLVSGPSAENLNTATVPKGAVPQADDDLEAPTDKSLELQTSASSESVKTPSIQTQEVDFLDGLSFGQKKKTKLQVMFPWFFQDQQGRYNVDVLGGSSGGGSSASGALLGCICPWLDSRRMMREEFISEMRLLSRLRHPCITTVMGAVISPVTDPMLVMEFMEHGSLNDLLRNETMYTGGEIILQICRDVAQGLRYLHASKPPIFHGDLKSKNILIDSRFRAKVADFGLSSKKKHGLSGTPFFMAPEYLRGKTEYTAHCDIYSFGILLYEIYSRKSPYHGENPREVLRKVCDPRVNKRPIIPDVCPPRMADIMKKSWSSDPFFRPRAEDLDMLFMDMSVTDAEPLKDTGDQMFNKPKEIKTEDMLYEVFPRHIADALKAGKKVEPESHEVVTVIFSDIVHFTNISKTISALKVSQMLDRLYMAFDDIAKRHGVFKVETIGDAYMGVTNLDGTQGADHVKRAAEFGVDLIEAASTIYIDDDDRSRGTIKVRVGFHSGPVVSNVIGTLNPRYGLFGDTVNTASRMESNSTSQKIHCSDISAKLLVEQAPKIPILKRGKIGVKGKGEMTTFWVGPSAMAKTLLANQAKEDIVLNHHHVDFA